MEVVVCFLAALVVVVEAMEVTGGSGVDLAVGTDSAGGAAGKTTKCVTDRKKYAGVILL